MIELEGLDVAQGSRTRIFYKITVQNGPGPAVTDGWGCVCCTVTQSILPDTAQSPLLLLLPSSPFCQEPPLWPGAGFLEEALTKCMDPFGSSPLSTARHSMSMQYVLLLQGRISSRQFNIEHTREDTVDCCLVSYLCNHGIILELSVCAFTLFPLPLY